MERFDLRTPWFLSLTLQTSLLLQHWAARVGVLSLGGLLKLPGWSGGLTQELLIQHEGPSQGVSLLGRALYVQLA